jgi:hypothetical protein
MEQITEACWEGYKQVGMKEKGGKMVPNCVPINETDGLSKHMSVDDIAKKHGVSVDQVKDQLKMGMKVEKEHTDSHKEAVKIAMDHLVEDPEYYTKLQDMEVDEYCSACLAEYIREHANVLTEAEYQGRKVPLGKPMQGDVAKFKVYVKDPKTGNVKKVNFGDKSMKIKKSNPKRRKSFRARHKCHTAKDRTSARYWSCRAW